MFANDHTQQQDDGVNDTALGLEAEQDRRSATSWRRQALERFGEILFLLLFPIAAFFALKISALNQAGALDPYFYTGYIHNLHDLLQRYGITYYGVRFGLILPARAFALTFGPETGYFAFRYVLVLVGGVPLFVLVKRHMGTWVAVVTYCALTTSPFLAKALFWDHPDASGVPYLLGGVCLFALGLRPAWLWDAATGGLFGLALNSNVFTSSQMGLFVAAFAVSWFLYRRRAQLLISRILYMVAGGAVVSCAGAAYYHHLIGVWDIYSPTISVSLWLSRGGMGNWRLPGVAWIASSFHVLALPMMSFFCLLATGFRRRKFIATVLTIYIGAVFAFYYLYQFAFKANSLQLHYYFAYSVPAVFLSIPVIFDRLWANVPKPSVKWCALGGIAGFGLPWVLKASGLDLSRAVDVGRLVAMIAATSVVLVLAIYLPWGTKPRLWLAGVGSILVGLSVDAAFSDRVYAPHVGAQEIHAQRERDVFAVSMQFMSVVPKFGERPGVIRFWYNNRRGNLINSVQSTYLWGFTKSHQNPATDPGMPHIGPFQLKVFQDRRVKYLGLIGESEEELGKGLEALTDKGLVFSLLERRVLASGGYRIYWQLIEFAGR
jgi:hypothetical protein